jgi:hypothetical protein
MVPVMQKVRPAKAEAEAETAEDFRFGGIFNICLVLTK